MNRIIFFVLLLAALPLMAYAGHTTIRETGTGIIVEYTGDEEEAKAAQIVKEQEEAKRAAEEENQRKIEEKNAEKRAKSEKRKAARSAEGEE